MARSAAQKRAFRKMLAGLRRFKAGKRRRRRVGGSRKRRRVTGARSRRRRVRAHRARAVVVVRNPKRGARHMARRHRRRRRGGVTAIMVNPRRRRRRVFSRRRRNPSGFLGDLMIAGIPAAVGGGALAFADASFLADKSAVARVGVKVVLAGLVGLVLRKRHPMWAAAGVATLITAAVMTEVTRMIAAQNGKDVAAGKQLVAGAPLLAAGTAGPAMKALIREDGRAMGVLVERGSMGATLDDNVSLGGAVETNALPAGTHFQDVRLG